MWHLLTDKTKAPLYAKEFWNTTTCRFHPKKQTKMYVPTNLQRTRAFQYLTKKVFEGYLTAEPSMLVNLHNALFNHVLNIPGKTFDQKEWYQYKKDNTKFPEYAIFDDSSDEMKAIKHIFNYDNFIAGNTNMSYFVAKLLDTNTCTYCNRQYTLTVIGRKGEKLIRPEFDHWFAQSLYPDLALSFYNLIPSCSFCNSILKNNVETELDTHIHPYLDSDAGFSFTYRNLPGNRYAVGCRINSKKDADYRLRVRNTLQLFRIQEVYEAHSELELKDLIDLATANPGDYITTLINNVMAASGLKEEDIMRMLFGIESQQDKYHKRPFSKFKTDIIAKLHRAIAKKGKP